MRLVGVDPGFAYMGVCLAEYDGKLLQVQYMHVIETKKDQRRVLACNDNVKRARKLFLRLQNIVERYEPNVICAESMSFPRNASAAAKMAMSWGVIVSISEMRGLPLPVQTSPQDIKLAVCDSKKASKEAMHVRLVNLYPEIEGLLDDIPASRQEHPIDALGAIVAALDSDIVKAGLRVGE